MPDLIDAKGEYFTKTAGSDSKLDFAIDWASFLTGTETIQSSTWTVPVGIIQDTPSPSIQGSKTIIWVSGGTAGIEYALVNKITTSDGRKEQRTLRIAVTPFPALAPNALIDLDYLKTFLGIYNQQPTENVDNVLFGKLIDSSSDKIERYCNRIFKTGDYVEQVHWNCSTNLKNYPVHYVKSIHRSTRQGLKLSNNATKDYATAWVSPNRKLYLNVSGGPSHGLATPIDLTAPLNATLSELITVINGLGFGWSASLATGRIGIERSEDLVGWAGALVDATNGLIMDMLGFPDALDYQLNEEAGIVKATYGSYAEDYDWVAWIKYRAGFDVIPADLQAVTARMCQFFYSQSKSDPTLESETIGDYSYQQRSGDSDGLPASLQQELDHWADLSRL